MIYRCDEQGCGKEFTTEKGLELHKRRVHEGWNPALGTHHRKRRSGKRKKIKRVTAKKMLKEDRLLSSDLKALVDKAMAYEEENILLKREGTRLAKIVASLERVLKTESVDAMLRGKGSVLR